nr:ankyrin repeat domain-containing protein [Rubrobacter marinus]
MSGGQEVSAPRSRRGARLPWLCLWLVLLPGLLSAACGARPEESVGPSPGGSSEMPSPPTVPEGTAEGASGAGAGEARSSPENGELDARLISAAGSGDAGTVERLLGEGASVRARDADGRTALVAAAYGNHLEAARVLVGAGADVNAKDETEQSAYLISTSEVGDDGRLLELTLENGADVRSLDSYDGTGLIRAADRATSGSSRGSSRPRRTSTTSTSWAGRRSWRRSSSAAGTRATPRSCGSSSRAARTRTSRRRGRHPARARARQRLRRDGGDPGGRRRALRGALCRSLRDGVAGDREIPRL